MANRLCISTRKRNCILNHWVVLEGVHGTRIDWVTVRCRVPKWCFGNAVGSGLAVLARGEIWDFGRGDVGDCWG